MLWMIVPKLLKIHKISTFGQFVDGTPELDMSIPMPSVGSLESRQELRKAREGCLGYRSWVASLATRLGNTRLVGHGFSMAEPALR